MKSDFQKTIESAQSVASRFYLNVSSRFAGSAGGNRFGRNTGNSLEYLDHREYQPGDDIRHIDWSAMARSDKVSVKLFREEVTPHLDILIDGSSSMNLENTEKASALWGLTELLRTAAINSGFSVYCWIVKDQCRKVEPNNLPMLNWPDLKLNYTGNTGKNLVDFPPSLKTRGVRIFLSDFFWEQEPATVLQQLSDNAALLVMIQVLAKKDIEPELVGNIRLIDCESLDATEIVANSAIMETYRKNFVRHQEYWKRSSTQNGALFLHSVAEDFCQDYIPVELLRSEILMTRS